MHHHRSIDDDEKRKDDGTTDGDTQLHNLRVEKHLVGHEGGAGNPS